MLTRWEILFICVMTIPIMGHVVILPLMIDVAGRDTWISVLLSLPAALFFAFAIYKLRLAYPRLSGKEIAAKVLGKWMGKAFTALFVIYFLFLTVLSFAALIDHVYIMYLPETPHVALILWFMIFFIYAAVKGIKRIALTAGVLTFIGMITGHTVTLMDSTKKDWGELTPILEYGWSPVFWGALVLISIWVELFIILFAPIQNIKTKRTFLVWSIAIFIVSLTMNSTTTGVIMIFGLEQADNFLYPATEIVRIIELGFIDRFDTYAMILMTLGTYIRCSLFFRFVYELGVEPIDSKWLKRIAGGLFVLIVFFGTLFIAKEHYRLEATVNFYTYLIVLYPIPFLLLILSWMKRKKADRIQTEKVE